MKLVPWPGLAVDADEPAVLLHDAVHRRETEAGALPDVLRREERLEQVRLRGGVHAAAGVAHGEHHVVAGGAVRV